MKTRRIVYRKKVTFFFCNISWSETHASWCLDYAFLYLPRTKSLPEDANYPKESKGKIPQDQGGNIDFMKDVRIVKGYKMGQYLILRLKQLV